MSDICTGTHYAPESLLYAYNKSKVSNHENEFSAELKATEHVSWYAAECAHKFSLSCC